MKTIFINILAFGTLLSSVFSITSKNPVISVIFLIATFVSGAGYLILIGIHFVGLSYIIVYVGAIAVLFLFIIMLINIKLTDILETGSQYTKNLPLAISIGSLFIFIIFSVIPYNYNNVPAISISIFLDKLTSLNAILSLGDSNNNLISFDIVNTILTNNSILSSPLSSDLIINDFQQIESLGYSLYTYGAALLITLSIILLLAMYATIVISGPSTKNNNYTSKSPSPYKVQIEQTQNLVTSSAATKTGSGNSIHNLTETKLLPNQGSYNNAIVDAEAKIKSIHSYIRNKYKCNEFFILLTKNSFAANYKDNFTSLLQRFNKFITYTVLGIIFFIIMWDLIKFQLFKIFIFTIISFAINMFISDNFKLSNNKFIKNLQKFVFTISILALIGIICYLFDVSIINTVFCDSDDDINNEVNKTKTNNNSNNNDIVRVTSNTDDKNEEYINIKIKKDLVENVMKNGKDLLAEGGKIGLNNIGNIGLGAAAGKAAVEVFKQTPGMAPAPRLALMGSTTLVTAFGTKLGLELAKSSIDNFKKETVIVALDETDKSGRNSPSNFDGGFIHSPLEDSEIPLIIMVNGLSYLNYIEFSLILSLFSLLFRKYLYLKLIRFFLTFTHSLRLFKENQNTKVENIKDEKLSLNKAINTLDKYTDYFIVFIFICLFWIMFINIYFSSHLAENIDSFVKVYNHIKNSSFIWLLFSLKNEYSVNNVCNKKNMIRNSFGLPHIYIFIGLFIFIISILLAIVDIDLLIDLFVFFRSLYFLAIEKLIYFNNI